MSCQKSIFLAILLPLYSVVSHAQVPACMIVSKAVIQGTTITINECIESAGASSEAIEQACEFGFKTAGNIFKNFGGVAPVKTRLATCPTKSAGKCNGNYGAPIISYFYDLPAEELGKKKKNCIAGGGKWQ